MRRLALVAVVVALLAAPAGATACDRNPGGAAELAARSTLLAAHPAVKAKKHAPVRRSYRFYGYYR